MTSLAPRILSASVDGRPVKVATNTTPGTLIHTATASPTLCDWITLYASNSAATDMVLNIAIGGTTAPDDIVTVTLKAQAGVVPVLESQPLRNGLELRAWATTSNVVTLTGKVVRES